MLLFGGNGKCYQRLVLFLFLFSGKKCYSNNQSNDYVLLLSKQNQFLLALVILEVLLLTLGSDIGVNVKLCL